MNKLQLSIGFGSIFILFISLLLFCGCISDSKEYDITVLKNQRYGYGINNTYDLYYPLDDEDLNPPLLIFAHSGAFVIGDKSNYTSELLAKSLAKKGIAVACVNYSLINTSIDLSIFNKINHYESFLKSEIHKSICDSHRAIKHFKSGGADSDIVNIDEENIFFGGFSAGGILSLQLYFFSPEETNSFFNVNNNEISDGKYSKGNINIEGEASSMLRGVIAISGGTFESPLSSNYKNKDIPLLMIHGTDDEIVLPHHGRPFYKNNNVDIPLWVNKELGVGGINEVITYSPAINSVLSYLFEKSTDKAIPFQLTGSYNIKNEYQKGNRNVQYKEYRGVKHNFFVDDKGKTTKELTKMITDINKFITNHKNQNTGGRQKKSDRY